MHNEKQLEQLSNLANDVENLVDKLEKKTGLQNTLKRIHTIIPETIDSNFSNFNLNDSYKLSDFRASRYNKFWDVIGFVKDNSDAIREYENDNEDKKQERNIKQQELRQLTFPKDKVVKRTQHYGIKTWVEEEKEENPDWIYSNYGTYTEYLSFKSHWYYPICLNIVLSNSNADFDVLNGYVLLYIAVNNELNNLNAILSILGIDMPEKQIEEVTTIVPKILSTNEYFKRRAVDNSELKNSIPELLKVIEELHSLRDSNQKTGDYINNWRKTKYKQTAMLPNENGEIVQTDIRNPDLTSHDQHINWLFFYFRYLYNNKIGATISYAFALSHLTQYHNQQILNRRTFGNEIDLPNINIDDVFDQIEKEEQSENIHPLSIIDYTKESEILKCTLPNIKQIFSVLKKYPVESSDFSPLAMINDLRRIEQYHESKPDECIAFIADKYKMRWAESTRFIECLKLIFVAQSDFMFLLNNQSFMILLSEKVKVDFAMNLNILPDENMENYNVSSTNKPKQTIFEVESLSEHSINFKLNGNEALIGEIHDHCNNKIFICTENEFVSCVQSANFALLNIKIKSKVKLLIFLLSKQMGSAWYSETAKSMSLQKSDCSGANVSDEKWKKEMKRIIPQ